MTRIRADEIRSASTRKSARIRVIRGSKLFSIFASAKSSRAVIKQTVRSSKEATTANSEFWRIQLPARIVGRPGQCKQPGCSRGNRAVWLYREMASPPVRRHLFFFVEELVPAGASFVAVLIGFAPPVPVKIEGASSVVFASFSDPLDDPVAF